MDSVSACNTCGEKANQKCGGCQNVFYCSKGHQKADWKNHKNFCRLFKISSNSEIGRHLIATKDIKPNEIILKEKPLISGPSQETVPVCLGCYQAITESNYRPCSKCGWPMCSEECEKKSCHIPECTYMTSREEKMHINDFGVIHPFYRCITVLRCLYQKEHNKEIWIKLDLLQSHCEERKETETYQNEKNCVANFILNFFNLKDTFSEEDIMRVCGIVMVNAHEVPLSEPSYIAIYEQTSMFEHDCRNIKKGNHLSICYCDPLWSTVNRRQFLNETKYFWCSCDRCADVTEFGTHFSAVRCQESSCEGILLPKSFLDNDSQDWNCDKCKYSVPYPLVNTLLEKIGKDLSNIERENVNACRTFLNKIRKILPDNNFYVVDVKLTLSQLIGQETSCGLSDVSNNDLEMKRKYCEELVELTELLIPSEKRVKGLLLFELHASLAELGRRRSVNFLNAEAVHSVLKESREKLLNCIELLKFEPDILPEGIVYQQALKNLQDLDQLLRKQSV